MSLKNSPKIYSFNYSFSRSVELNELTFFNIKILLYSSMKHQLLIDILIKKNPHIQTLITRLDLHHQHDHARDSRIQAKVEELLQTSTLLPRQVHRFSIFQTDTDVKKYLSSTYGTPPWKYPLSSAPF